MWSVCKYLNGGWKDGDSLFRSPRENMRGNGLKLLVEHRMWWCQSFFTFNAELRRLPLKFCPNNVFSHTQLMKEALTRPSHKSQKINTLCWPGEFANISVCGDTLSWLRAWTVWFNWTCLERRLHLPWSFFDQINPINLIFRIPSPLQRGSVALTLAIIFPWNAKQHCHICAAKHQWQKWLCLLMYLIFFCRCGISSWPHGSQALLRAGWTPLHLCSDHDSPFCEGKGQSNPTQTHLLVV